MLLGDGNWKMGDGVLAKPNKGKPAPGSESVLIAHYTCKLHHSPPDAALVSHPPTTDDVVTTLLGSLTSLARMQKRPSFGSVFLLNNTSYLCAKLLQPRSPVLEILTRQTQDAINSNFRTAKAGYFDSNFSPLLQALADDKDKSGGGKAAAKEKFTRFFDLLEETRERHQLARVLEDDDDQREMLEDEVVKLVVPSLQRFTQKMREKEFSKSELQVSFFQSSSIPSAKMRNLYRSL
jgi:exocyst complex protein 7